MPLCQSKRLFNLEYVLALTTLEPFIRTLTAAQARAGKTDNRDYCKGSTSEKVMLFGSQQIQSFYLYTMHNHLTNIISQKVTLSDRDIDLCNQYFEPVHIPKNRIVEEEGKVPKYLYFVVSGFMRLFHYNDNGDEITSHINCPPGFITSYFNFINETKADVNVEAVTECELLRITKKDLDFLIKQSSSFKNFSIWVFQQSIAYNENRSKELATLSAEQRYKKLIENYPQILHNVPLQYIASFLGMNSKSLSRIRKQIIK